jgi:hypothetical protein
MPYVEHIHMPYVEHATMKLMSRLKTELETWYTNRYLLALAEGVAANGRLGFGVTVLGLLILEGGFNPEGFGSPDELMLLVLSFLSEVFPH